ncbi:mechanosensitive ion channel domain-containing protein [Petrimonas sp.]|uniref:mechanosensitive ion channel family protein n=1 Tax=Petrimonas sp. TaxID=2023866 RepID=UPI0033210913
MIQDEMEQLKDNVASDRVESFSQQVTNLISGWSKDFLHGTGVPDTYIGVINSIFLSVILVVLVYVMQTMLRKLITVILNKAVKINRLTISRHLINNKFPKYLAMIIPISIIKGAIPIIFNDFPVAMRLSLKVFDVFFVFYFMWLSVSVINAFTDTLKTKDNFKDKPVESFGQLIRIFVYAIGAIVIISLFIGKTPTTILAGLGAASAILLLIFKDTILGLVASIQVSSNDMVRIGDWITMPKYGVDGDVIKINLTTVKILNFDKTITTIPPYSLVTEAFQNWRGMTEAGGRRIKRAINIKQSTIHYVNEQELEHFRKIQLLSGYIDERKQIIDSFNNATGADRSLPLNGRNFTNMGLFRKYVELYLKNHPQVHQELLLLVRQLAPTAQGLPLELYLFTATTSWTEYENIMSDIFDHVTAAVPYFGLEIFEDVSNPLRMSSAKTDTEKMPVPVKK